MSMGKDLLEGNPTSHLLPIPDKPEEDATPHSDDTVLPSQVDTSQQSVEPKYEYFYWIFRSLLIHCRLDETSAREQHFRELALQGKLDISFVMQERAKAEYSSDVSTE